MWAGVVSTTMLAEMPRELMPVTSMTTSTLSACVDDALLLDSAARNPPVTLLGVRLKEAERGAPDIVSRVAGADAARVDHAAGRVVRP